MYTLNGFQSISVIGIIFSVFCQICLIIIGKDISNMWALYPTWLGVFIVGSIFKYFGLDKGDDHHH